MWDKNYYSYDFSLAKALGLNAFKISIEWSRVEPKRNEWDDDMLFHYKEMIKTMRSTGLIPIVALNHLTLPQWVLTPPSEFKKKFYQYLLPSPLRDLPISDPPPDDPYWKSIQGWENYETVELFINYVRRAVELLKDEVDYWITLGEPVASVIGGGYLAGIYPPGYFLDGNRAKKALHNLIEAHVQAYDVISEIDNIDADSDGFTKKVGISHFMTAALPEDGSVRFQMGYAHNSHAADNFRYFINDYFLNAIINGEEDLNYLETLRKADKNSDRFLIREGWKNKIDFIGLNYYRRVHISSSKILSLSSARFLGGVFKLNEKNNLTKPEVNDLGWEIYPRGIYEILKYIKDTWNKPVLITENGVADASDRIRAPFIVSHLRQISNALKEGVDIIGYLHWSMTDNYEWIEGYRPEGKFGLFYINHESLDDRRKITKGANALKLIIEESFVDDKSGVISDRALVMAEEKYGTFSPDGSSS